MNRFLRIASIAMIVLMLVSFFATTALAASTGTSAASETITVKTGGNWLVAPKLTINFQKGSGIDSDTGATRNSYSYWTIKVYDSKGKCVQSKINYWGSQVTITGLKRNSTYKITVKEDRNNRIIGTGVLQWKRTPSWYVGITKNISSVR